MPNKKKNTASFKTFISNPIVGGIGLLVGVIGIVLTITFYIRGNRVRELTYYVNPIRASIVSAHQASRLMVTYDNKPVQSDISAVQVAFWNAGDESIRQENILRPLVIQTSNHVPILEARIKKTSRDIIGINIDVSKINDGQVTLTWNILERNDGGIIEIILAGSSETNISANAIIEGQTKLKQLTFHGSILSPSEQFISQSTNNNMMGWLFPSVGLITLVFVWINRNRKRADYAELKTRGEKVTITIMNLVMLGFPILMILLGLAYLFYGGTPLPPFGF